MQLSRPTTVNGLVMSDGVGLAVGCVWGGLWWVFWDLCFFGCVPAVCCHGWVGILLKACWIGGFLLRRALLVQISPDSPQLK